MSILTPAIKKELTPSISCAFKAGVEKAKNTLNITVLKKSGIQGFDFMDELLTGQTKKGNEK